MSNELIESRPSFLAPIASGEDVMGEMRKHMKPPYIKIIQSQTGEPFKPPFMDGDIIVPPGNVKIGDMSTPFSFTPVYGFTTYLCFNPIQTKGTLQSLRDFSFDENSDVAKKCKAFIKEKCPERPEFLLKYNTVINYFVIVHGFEELMSIPVTLSFKGGEFKTGQTLINMISARQAYPYACRFRAASSHHKNPQFRWIGLDLQNDSKPWIDDEVTYNKYKKLHDDLAEALKNRQLDLTDQFSDGVSEENDANESKF